MQHQTILRDPEGGTLLSFDPAKPTAAKATFDVELASVDTGGELSISAVPEPESWTLALGGLAAAFSVEVLPECDSTNSRLLADPPPDVQDYLGRK